MVEKLGSENIWQKISVIPEEKWLKFRKDNNEYFHRFWEAKGERSIARRIRRIAKNILEKFDGDVRNVWNGRTSDELYEILKKDIQVNKSNSDATIRMIVLALAENNIIKGVYSVKPDTHVKTVLGRVFYGKIIQKDKDAIELASKISPENPGKIDLSLFDLGKDVCKKSEPNCVNCALNKLCKFYKPIS